MAVGFATTKWKRVTGAFPAKRRVLRTASKNVAWPKKLKLQQERAVIPAGNSGLGAKTVTSGENARHIQRPPPAGPNPT